jgi:hypothetical protein
MTLYLRQAAPLSHALLSDLNRALICSARANLAGILHATPSLRWSLLNYGGVAIPERAVFRFHLCLSLVIIAMLATMTAIGKASIIGLASFLLAVIAGLYSSLCKWAGPSPTIEFLSRTDLRRIWHPALLAPIGFPLLFPPLALLPIGVGLMLYFGYRRNRWTLILLGFACLGAYWYGMVQLAWSFD